jgi:uncharacterized protein (DUF697 family)
MGANDSRRKNEMTQPQTETPAKPASTTPAQDLEARKLREKAAAEKRISTEDSGLLDEEADLLEKESTDRLNIIKFKLYKDYAEGRIGRGRLDRKLEDLEIKEHLEMPGDIAPPKTPRQPEAEKIVGLYSKLAAASGLVPFPLVDTLALSALQVRMIMKLADLYGAQLSHQWVSATVSTLLGSLTPSFLKGIPGLGTLIGVITGPAFNYAATSAVGMVFIQQFESGSTMLSLDPAKMKAYFADYFSSARN